MDAEVAAKKALLRREIRARVQALPAVQRELASANACALLQRQRVWSEAKSVLFFAPLPNELNLWALIPEALAAGKTVALPRYLPDTDSYSACEIRDIEADCAPGQFGIQEPRAGSAEILINQLDLLLVPGIAFDPLGHRLGRGRGYYDRWLASVSGIRCGVAFDEQIIERIPVESHDVRVNCVLTPTQWMNSAGANP